MIERYIDHTYLKPVATESDIKQKCIEAKKYNFASVCINPCNVKVVADMLKGSGIHVTSVVGFPFGTHKTLIKKVEAEEAIKDGADEIDMVINLGKFLEGNYEYVETEIKVLSTLCHEHGKILKVIVETCYLNELQIVKICEIVEKAHADYIKTSTGYGTRGASPKDIVIFKKHLKGTTKIKASGGIRTLADVKQYIELGCDRIGTSNGVSMVEEENAFLQ